MAAVLPTSMLSRTRSNRMPGSGRPAPAFEASAVSSSHASAGTPAASQIPVPTSHVSVFLTNLRLLDLDRRPDWPGITARTFATKDATQGQKRRIQSVEWALYHLFCLWDPEEVRRSMQKYFPPTDQVQSVNLRNALLRGLEQAKKSGALGRDAILRKTMLDECRGERLEEILAVFSSAVLKKAVAAAPGPAAVACALALENRGYSAERTELNALVLAHKASLARMLREKEVARARYKDFAELLALKERSLARRRELAKAQQEAEQAAATAAAVSDDARLHLQRLVRNNWSGSDQWMHALLYGDDRARTDGLLSTPPDRVWRRVRAGRLSELESKSGSGLLEQLDKRVAAQKARLQRWDAFSQHVFGKPLANKTAEAPTRTQRTAETGVDLGFGAHTGLYPVLPAGPRRGSAEQAAELPHNDDYAGLLQRFHDDVARIGAPQQGQTEGLLASLAARRAAASDTAKAAAGSSTADDSTAQDAESDISDIDEHPLLQQPAISAPASEDSESPTRRRVLLTKKSMTFSVASYHSDDEPEPLEFLPPQVQRAATIQMDHQPLPKPQPAGGTRNSLSGPANGQQPPLPIRRRQLSPSIRPPRAARRTPPPHDQRPPAPQTPSPDRSPPPPTPPSDEDGPLELVSTPQHSIVLQPPPPSDGGAVSPSQELADQILASMSNASPSPMKRPRHTLSLAERTRLSMARASRGTRLLPGAGDSDDDEHGDGYGYGDGNDDGDGGGDDGGRTTAAVSTRAADKSTVAAPDQRAARAGAAAADTVYEDLVARTRKSMAGFEASRQKAQLERRRSQRKARQSSASASLGVGPSAAALSTASSRRDAAASAAAGHGYFPAVEEGEGDDNTMLAEELMAGGQDDPEAIFRSRPKIKMSPIPSPTRGLEDE